MRKWVGAILMAALVAFGQAPSKAQAFDPRQPLGIIISAFQTCGPPQAYQLLAPDLFNQVAVQTGGSGCYADISGAGPITNMIILGSQEFPIGPLYLIRVGHSSGAVADWFVGFNRVTGKIEYLRFQAPQTGVTPTISTGPSPTGNGPSPQPGVVVQPQPQPEPGSSPAGKGGTGGDTPKGCQLYPAMCS